MQERELTHAEELALEHTEYCDELYSVCPVCRDNGEQFIRLMEEGFTGAAAIRILRLEGQV